MNFSRHITWVASTSLTLAILTGCGSPPPPPPSAAKDIDDAGSSISSARSLEKQGQLDASIAAYQRAKDAIARGKEVAEGSELSQLNSMEDEARAQMSALQIKKINLASQPEKPKPIAVSGGPKSEDPEEKQKREAEAKAAKLKAETAKASAQLDATFQKGVAVGKAKPKQADEDEPAAKPEKKAESKDGDDQAAAGDPAAAPKGKAIKEAKGPFPAITEQSPEIEIVKLQVKGKFAIAYFYVKNKSDNGRRIMNQAIYFKNANGQEVVNAPSVALYPYVGFKSDNADPSTQNLDGITVGSHQVNGGDAMQFAAVGSSDSVAQCKSVGVIMVFDDGTKLTASGPSGGIDLNAGGGDATGPLKGLKGK